VNRVWEIADNNCISETNILKVSPIHPHICITTTVQNDEIIRVKKWRMCFPSASIVDRPG